MRRLLTAVIIRDYHNGAGVRSVRICRIGAEVIGADSDVVLCVAAGLCNGRWQDRDIRVLAACAQTFSTAIP